MKKYFLFDNEPITGWNYLARFIIGSMLILLFGLGLWILAASAYKRSGAFRWDKSYRVFMAILIPILAVTNILANAPGYLESSFNLIDFIGFTGAVFHLILLFKNGNKIEV